MNSTKKSPFHNAPDPRGKTISIDVEESVNLSFDKSNQGCFALASSKALNSRSVCIPTELIESVIEDDKKKELKVYIAAKIVTSGVFNKKSVYYTALSKYVGLEKRTLDKYLKSLINMGWMGYNYETQNYFVRSWATLRLQEYFIYRHSVKFTYDDMKTFNQFISGTLISKKIQQIKYSSKRAIKNPKKRKALIRNQQKGRLLMPVAVKDRATLQGYITSGHSSTMFPDYYGIGNHRIAKLLGCKYTSGCNKKHGAESAGYINTFRKFEFVLEIKKYCPGLRNIALKGLGEEANKLRYFSLKGKSYLVKQLHDEIVPQMVFKKINYVKLAKKKALKRFTPKKSVFLSDNSHKTMLTNTTILS